MIALRDRPGVRQLAADRKLAGERLAGLLEDAVIPHDDPESDPDMDRLTVEPTMLPIAPRSVSPRDQLITHADRC